MNPINRLYFWTLFLALIFAVMAFSLAAIPAMAHNREIPTYVQVRLHDVITQIDKASEVEQIDTLDLTTILALLGHKNHRVASAAAYALGETRNSKAVPALIAALNSDRAHMRRIAAHALGKIGDPRAVLPLIEVLGDKAQPLAVQTSVVMSLGKIGDPKAEWILNELNHSARKWLQQAANLALLKIKDKQGIRS